MVEQKLKELPIEENGQYKNISLKQKWDQGDLLRDGLGDGEYVIVNKDDNFSEGLLNNGKFGPSYSCKVKYKDEQVSFWLNEKEHVKFAEVGDCGDTIKILNLRETFTYQGKEKKKDVLYFSKVE